MNRPADRLAIGLVQIDNSFSGQNYLPYSVGLLQAFVQAHAPRPERYEFLLPLHRRLRVAEAVERLRTADVAAFSLSVWNVRLSLEIARRFKERRPETLVVCGGPQVPDRAEEFLRRNPCVDVVCHGEGEATFLELLEREPDRDWTGCESISFLDGRGRFTTTPRRERLRDPSLVPSPYLSGVFDPLMAAHPHERWLMLWETNRGCPFSCTFCDWGSAVASKVHPFDLPRLRREIDWMADRRIEFVFCCDANFGILPRDLELARCVAETKAARGWPHALSVQNTKNAAERAYAVQKLLSDAGLDKGVTVSMQSLDPATLTAVKRRNISYAAFEDLQRRFARDRIATYTDLILGLPEETGDSFVDGVDRLIEQGQHDRIQFNDLSILPNAAMGDPEYRRKYGMETVESRIVNGHGTLLDDEIPEFQELVIATRSMPRDDWRQARAFCWLTALLHFDKTLQIPLVLARTLAGVRYRALFEAFLHVDGCAFPTLGALRDFFLDKARDVQQGGVEYVHSERWLGIYWPADEFALIRLATEDRLDDFYREAGELLCRRVAGTGDEVAAAIREAVRFNHALLKRPFQTDDLEFHAERDLWGCYRGVLEGRPVPLRAEPQVHRIDRTSRVWSSWEDWCRDVIWYGNKKGAYLYPSAAVEPQLAGHH